MLVSASLLCGCKVKSEQMPAEYVVALKDYDELQGDVSSDKIPENRQEKSLGEASVVSKDAAEVSLSRNHADYDEHVTAASTQLTEEELEALTEMFMKPEVNAFLQLEYDLVQNIDLDAFLLALGEQSDEISETEFEDIAKALEVTQADEVVKHERKSIEENFQKWTGLSVKEVRTIPYALYNEKYDAYYVRKEETTSKGITCMAGSVNDTDRYIIFYYIDGKDGLQSVLLNKIAGEYQFFSNGPLKL